MSRRGYGKLSDSSDSGSDGYAINSAGSKTGYGDPEELLNPLDGSVLKSVDTYERPLTPGRAAFNVATVAIGAGVLALPAALNEGGWIGLGLLLILALAAAYTAALIGRCQYESGKLEDQGVDFRTYGDIGYAAAGNFGKYFTAIQVYMTLLGVGSIFVVLSIDFVHALREQFSDGPAFEDWQAVLVVLPFLWLHVWVRDLKMLGNFAFLSIAVTFYMEVAVIIQLLGFSEYRCSEDPHCSFVTANGDLSFMIAIVTFAFAFGAHPTLPTIGTRMTGYHKKYEPVMWGTFMFMAVAYIPFTAICYWTFGTNASAPILDNLEDGFVKASSILAILTNIIISYPVVLKAVEDGLENAFRISPENNLRCVLQRAGARTLIVGITILIALSIPNFGLILNLVAALTNTFTMFVLPCSFYLLLHGKKLREGSWKSRAEIPLCVIIIIFGFSACGIGTYDAILGIMEL